MIESSKNLTRKNQKLTSIYKKLLFFKSIPLRDFFDSQKLILFRKVYPYTMVSYERLSNTYELAKLIEKDKTHGTFVECGVWRGGCAAVLAFVADQAKSNRKIWLFDSFEGLPEPTFTDGTSAQKYALNRSSGKLSAIGKCAASLSDVNEVFFSILKINKKNVIIKKGWFQNTLPESRKAIGPIAILRLDADWYESTKCCLGNLYDQVIPGGYIIIDDYGHWPGCKRAIDEFFQKRKINVDLIEIDDTGVYFKKS